MKVIMLLFIELLDCTLSIRIGHVARDHIAYKRLLVPHFALDENWPVKNKKKMLSSFFLLLCVIYCGHSAAGVIQVEHCNHEHVK